MPVPQTNFGSKMVVPLCSEIFSGQTHTVPGLKFHSESFAVWVCPLNISQKDSYMQFSVLQALLGTRLTRALNSLEDYVSR